MGTYARYSGFAGTGTGGTGTVTSVGLADGSTSAIYTITGSPVTTSGTLTFSLKTRSANTVFAGPTTGAAAQPTFRSLVSADISALFGNLTDVGTDGITITGGTGVVLGAGTSIAQQVADATHNGYLSSTDWNTFNGKQASVSIGNFSGTSTAKGLDITSAVITLHAADGTNPGAVSTTTQTFAGQKTFSTGLTGTLTGAASLNVLTSALGNLTDAGTDGITVTGGTGAVVGTVSIAQHVADASHNGYLTSTDWSTFNSKLTSPMTTLGDIIYEDGTPTAVRLAGNTTSTKKFLTQTGTGTVSAAPGWNTIVGSDIPNPSSSTLGGVQSAAAVSNQWINSISTSGVPALSQPAFSNLSGSAAAAQVTTSTFTAPTVQSFASGTGTYTTPTSPRTPLYLIIEMVGGGGGGGCSGTSGGTAAGNGVDSTFSVHSGAAILTAGGGLKGAYDSDGGNGGAATIAAGATKIIAVSGGQGGGSERQATSVTTATPRVTGGIGGSSAFGGAGHNGAGGGASTGGGGATNTGGGGGGGEIGNTSNAATGSGGGSGAYIKALVTSPSASYDYVVGGGGSGQVTVNGAAGGAGGSGYIVVTEYYQ